VSEDLDAHRKGTRQEKSTYANSRAPG